MNKTIIIEYKDLKMGDVSTMRLNVSITTPDELAIAYARALIPEKRHRHSHERYEVVRVEIVVNYPTKTR